jgi:hypothetical protein
MTSTPSTCGLTWTSPRSVTKWLQLLTSAEVKGSIVDPNSSITSWRACKTKLNMDGSSLTRMPSNKSWTNAHSTSLINSTWDFLMLYLSSNGLSAILSRMWALWFLHLIIQLLQFLLIRLRLVEPSRTLLINLGQWLEMLLRLCKMDWIKLVQLSRISLTKLKELLIMHLLLLKMLRIKFRVQPKTPQIIYKELLKMPQIKL